MFKKIMMTALAVSAIALNAPAAQALAVQGRCNFDTLAQETATGGQDTFTGAAEGFAVSDQAGANISVICEVRVNGSPVASTPTLTSGQVSTTAGPVTYTAADTDNVELCAVWTGTESDEFCSETTTTQIPPQEVIDLINEILALTGLIDPILCPILIGLAPGIPGVVDITATGDVYILGIWFWDCPPYGV